jgi:uncharacterized SAM-binding protein YcdF (DUF218 family)
MMSRATRLALRAVGALILIVVVVWGAIVLAVVFAASRDAARPADAIVVLGAAHYEGRPSPVLRARLDHAVALWEQDLAPRMIMTGGTGRGDTTSEAAVGRRYVMARGVPDSAIVVEDQGLTSSQSMRAVAELLHRDAPQVIVVSDPFHMLRLSILSRRLGMTPYTSPTPNSPIWLNRGARWRYVLGESVKVPLAFILERRSE